MSPMARIKRGICSVALLCLFSVPALADWLDININDETLFLEYSYMPFYESNLHMSFGYLYYSESDGDDVHAGMIGMFIAERLAENTSVAIGGKAYAIDALGEKAVSIALGGAVRQNFSFAPLAGVEAYGYMAPKVTSFGKAERMFEAGARVFYEVLVNADVYLGYRNLQVKYDGGSMEEAEDGFHIGLRMRF